MIIYITHHAMEINTIILLSSLILSFIGGYLGAKVKSSYSKTIFQRILPKKAKVVTMYPEVDLGETDI